MADQVECLLWCDACGEKKYTLIRQPAEEHGGNPGVFLNKLVFVTAVAGPLLRTPPVGTVKACPDCGGQMRRVGGL